jgi:2',3'-cyclic-nucleotide 2'-phosphodiesterase (5'-nucleotidase family)
MGEKEPIIGISSHELIAATRGIDAVLDGHTHSVIESEKVNNLDGKPVLITQTGTQFANIGKMVISTDGKISTSLFAPQDLSYTNAAVQHTIDSIYQLLDEVTHRQLATCAFDLTINGPDGKRLVRKGETNMADIVTDAFREVTQAQIGLCNGGGIRASIPAGIITYGDAINVQPFNNQMVIAQASGSTIVAMLESCTASLPEEIGAFPQVSGLRFTVHQISHTVTDVEVFDETLGSWLPIDPAATYSVGTTEYCITDGMNGTLKSCPMVKLPGQYDGDTFAYYLETSLGGVVPDRYASPQSRITILND